MTVSDPQHVGNDTVSCTTLDIVVHDLDIDKIGRFGVKGNAPKKVLNGIVGQSTSFANN